MTLKRGFFWLHLVVGLAGGVFIALLALTGASIAYGPQLIAWNEREITRVDPGEEPRLTPGEQLAVFREEHPDLTPSAITEYADPTRATLIAGGRGKPSYYVDPYTGEVRRQGAENTRAFVTFMTGLHRWLALPGDGRKVGEWITGLSSLAFFTLCASGLIIWWPKQFTRARLRHILWFTGASGKARDWNWHNVIGFWSLPVLTTLALTGAAFSFTTVHELAWRIFGEKPPVRAEGGQRRKSAGIPEYDFDKLAASAKDAVPEWESVAFRFAGENAKRGVTLTVKRGDTAPIFAQVSLTLDPESGKIIKRENFFDKTPGEQLGGSIFNIHTGIGFGWFGQTVAFLVSLGAIVLAYTGFALSWRRFMPKKKTRHHQHRGESHDPETITPAA